MPTKIKVNEQTLSLFRNGHIVEANGETYMYFPFWLKKTDEEFEFELLGLEKLPTDLIDSINRIREGSDSMLEAIFPKPEINGEG